MTLYDLIRIIKHFITTIYFLMHSLYMISTEGNVLHSLGCQPTVSQNSLNVYGPVWYLKQDLSQGQDSSPDSALPIT